MRTQSCLYHKAQITLVAICRLCFVDGFVSTLIFPDDDAGQVVNAHSRASPSGVGLVNKNVASMGPQQIHIGTLVGNLHIGDVINVSATTSNNSAAQSQSASGSGSRDDREGDGLFSVVKQFQ